MSIKEAQAVARAFYLQKLREAVVGNRKEY